MFGRDQSPEPDVDGRAAAERLSALGLLPPAGGWVPDQPSAQGSPDPSVPPVSAAVADAPPVASATVSDGLRLAVADRLPLWAQAPLERISVATLAAVLVAVLAVVVAGVAVVHRHGGTAGGSYSASAFGSDGSGSSSTTPADPSTSAPLTSDAQSLVVDVGGRVRKPGLVTLPVGARVADAIRAADGPLHPRELARIDLAARVADGQLLLIGVRGGATGASDSGSSADGGASTPVSLSTATIDQLETLPGVGPVTAQKIIDWRTAHGGFTSVSQLQQVPGIGPAHYAEISPLVSP